jgi:hypothetical protein
VLLEIPTNFRTVGHPKVIVGTDLYGGRVRLVLVHANL